MENSVFVSSYSLLVLIKGEDITLEDVDYSFKVNIDENIPVNVNEFIKIIQNRLDITEFLWQNILVEVPSKVKDEKNKDLTLKGNGWRLVTEDELNRGNNSPFSELSDIFDSRKE